MSVYRNGVQYQVVYIPLDAAGKQEFQYPAAYWKVIRFETTSDGGATWQPALDGEVKLSIGRDKQDDIPLLYNNSVISPDFGMHGFWTISWAAQTNRRCVLLFSPNSELLADTPNPHQIVVLNASTTLTNSTVSVGTSATLISASNLTRQSCIIQNDGTVDVFIGSATVTTSNGQRVIPGASIVVDRTTAAIYGIAGTAGQTVRVMEE